MVVERLVTQKLEVDAIRLRVPVESDSIADGEIPAGMFGLSADGRQLVLVLELDSRRVRGWPGGTAEVHLKPRDEGTYELLAGETVVATRQDYVPDCLPQEYGDYLVMDIAEDGSIEGWNPRDIDVAVAFFPERRR